MRDLDQLKKLKTRYADLMRLHGEQVAEYTRFRQALLELNRKHRQDALRMYSQIISRIEKKTKAKK
jgi:hypothetical protein